VHVTVTAMLQQTATQPEVSM